MDTPIVIFSYNRPSKLQQLLHCLEKQTAQVDKIPVILFQDGPKNVEDKNLVDECVIVFKKATNLRNKILVSRNKNYGLRKNVENGLSSIFNYYERAIVLEDDLSVSNIFVEDMLDMLDVYQDDDKIHSVSGLSISDYVRNTDISTKSFSSLGWATWKSSWLNKCNSNLSILLFILKNRKGFDLNNRYPHSTNFIYNLFGLTNSWAIYMQATVLMQRKLVVYSKFQTVTHEGIETSATHYTSSHSSHIQNKLTNHTYHKAPRCLQYDQFFENKLLSYNLRCSSFIRSSLSALKISLIKLFSKNA